MKYTGEGTAAEGVILSGAFITRGLYMDDTSEKSLRCGAEGATAKAESLRQKDEAYHYFYLVLFSYFLRIAILRFFFIFSGGFIMESFIAKLEAVNSAINNVVWGIPALTLLVGTGILMTVLTKGFQFTRFGHMMKETIGGLFKKKDILKNDDVHSISQFQALCTALSATIGTGNIAGIAYAITMGGTGAIFWMWVAAIFGMMTNYSENVLGIYFRRRNEQGEWCGGAMYYLRDGLGAKKNCQGLGKVLAIFFSI